MGGWLLKGLKSLWTAGFKQNWEWLHTVFVKPPLWSELLCAAPNSRPEDKNIFSVWTRDHQEKQKGFGFLFCEGKNSSSHRYALVLIWCRGNARSHQSHLSRSLTDTALHAGSVNSWKPPLCSAVTLEAFRNNVAASSWTTVTGLRYYACKFVRIGWNTV